MAVEDERSDQTLLQVWREGDEAAGSVLVRRHFDIVVRFLERRVSPDALSDLIQTSFVAVVEAREKIPEGVRFPAYLLGIARNKLLMHLRKQRYTLDDGEPVADPKGDSLHRPSQLAAAMEEQHLLTYGLSRLELDLQIVLEMHYWEDMSTADIACVLGIPKGTVKTRLFRARKQLKELLEAEGAPLALAESTVRNMKRWAQSVRRQRDSG